MVRLDFYQYSDIALIREYRVLFLNELEFRFFFTNAALALFASWLNWADGLLSTIIMSLLSIAIAAIMVYSCCDMLKNDDFPDKNPDLNKVSLV